MIALLAFGLPLASAQITFDMAIVGNPGNANDSTGYGAVAYDYRIQTTEVSLFHYTAFLQAVAATDTYNLYNSNMGSNANIEGITRNGISGSYTYSVSGTGARPVTFVNWFDAARFANWVANGQPMGAQGNATTENGAYTLSGATSGATPTKNAINPNTGATTTFWLPDENEWYKAAYYDPSAGGPPGDDYWLYPTRSDTAPGNAIGAGTNQANYYAGDFSVTQSSSYSSGQNYLTEGGAFGGSASFYGTYDQAGNVWEWHDPISGSSPGIRGGSWVDIGSYMESSYRGSFDSSSESSSVGFRLASIPEPSTAALMLIAGGAYWFIRRRKASR